MHDDAVCKEVLTAIKMLIANIAKLDIKHSAWLVTVI